MDLAPVRSLKLGGTALARAYVGTAPVWAGSRPTSRPTPIGGGGWVTGLSVSGDRVYARTDVGGAYCYDTSAGWRQVLTSSGVPSGSRAESDYQVEAMAAAPSRPDVVYIAVGDGPGGRLMRSSDAGRTWRDSPTRLLVAGNAPERVANTRLAVDPDQPDVAYFGSRGNGLLLTTDGGLSWSQLTGLPGPVGDGTGVDAIGVSCVAVDPRSAVVQGRHQGLWAGVLGRGLLRSVDGGLSWQLVSAWTATAAYVRDLAIAVDGTVFGAFYAPGPASGDVRRVSPSGSVTSIAPKPQPWTSVAVHPTKPDVVYIAPEAITKWHSYYWTSSGRAGLPTWNPLTTFQFARDSTGGGRWLADRVAPSPEPYLWVGQIRFVGDTVFLAEGRGVWQASTPAGETVTWTSHNNGLEELVANAVHKPRGHALLTCQWDYGLLRHDGAADAIYRTSFGSGWDICSSPTDPNVVVVLMDDHQDVSGRRYPDRRASGYSLDGGRSFTRFEALRNGTAPADLLFGNIAVSAGSSTNMVWVPSNLSGTQSRVYCTLDRGVSWTRGELEGLTSATTIHPRYTYARHIVCPHPTQTGVFYLLGHDGSGGPLIWCTMDGGRAWTRLTTTGITGASFRYNATLVHDGRRLWAVPGDGGNGIFSSPDGAAWTRSTGIESARGLAVGAQIPGSSEPAIYTWAHASDGRGVCRSTDAGRSWQRIAHDLGGIYSGVRHLAGDPVIPGRVYIAWAGGLGFSQLDANSV